MSSNGEHERANVSQQEASDPVLCSNGCGFYGCAPARGVARARRQSVSLTRARCAPARMCRWTRAQQPADSELVLQVLQGHPRKQGRRGSRRAPCLYAHARAPLIPPPPRVPPGRPVTRLRCARLG